MGVKNLEGVILLKKVQFRLLRKMLLRIMERISIKTRIIVLTKMLMRMLSRNVMITLLMILRFGL